MKQWGVIFRSFYIAAPQGVAAKLSSMLLAAQIMPSGVVHTGVEAVRAAQGGRCC